MAEIKNTSTTITFGGGDEGSIPVVFEGHSGACNIFEHICYRVYPYEVTDVRASVGEVGASQDGGIVTKKQFLTFNNSDTTSLDYPVQTMLSMSLNVYFDTKGNIENSVDYAAYNNGAPAGTSGAIGLTFDPETNSVVASAPFFGLVNVEYTTSYRILHYVPHVETGGSKLFNGTKNYFTSAEFGMLAAFFRNTITTFATSRLDAGVGSDDTFEIYRVSSDAMVNAEGAWEVPEGFPTKTWPDQGAPSGQTAYMVYERVHEVGYLTGTSTIVNVSKYTVRNEKPKEGVANWKPQYKGSITSGSSAVDTIFEAGYNTVDFESIKADLKIRYPKITGLK